MATSSSEGPRFPADYEHRTTSEMVTSSYSLIGKREYDEVLASRRTCTVHLYLPFTANPATHIRSGIEWKLRLGHIERSVQDTDGLRTRTLEPSDAIHEACSRWWTHVQALGPGLDLDQLRDLVTSFAYSQGFKEAVETYASKRRRSEATVPASVFVYLEEWRLRRIEDVPEAVDERTRRDARYTATRSW